MTQPVLRRLTKRGEFLFVRAGVRAGRGCLTVEARRRADAGPIGLGFTASRKVGGAVVRNRARRRLREASRRLFPEHGIPGVDYVVVARASIAGASWDGLLDDMRNALIRLRAQLHPAACAPVRERRGTPTKNATESE